MSWWRNLPNWGKATAAVVAGCAAIGTAATWGMSGLEQISTESERRELEQHHNSDIQKVLSIIAEEKKYDRIQRNRRELTRLERDLLGGKYSTDEELQFMRDEIRDLKRAIRCDEEGVCHE